MNALRRRKLENVWTTLEEVVEQEQVALDVMPENLAETAKGDDIQSNIDELEEAKDLIREVIDR